MSPVAISTHTPPKLTSDSPRRPSPWHELAHSLSSTPIPTLKTCRSSSTSVFHTPAEIEPDPLSPLSSSQALREWEARLSLPDAPVTRHHLSPRPTAVPKLAAERDKEGHIEYKLKLIDPTPERFERLVTQMMWRLMQGRNEAIYEIGLADDGTVIGLTRAEMDASLRTLELMASEVGATVLVLKEIVLAGRKVSPGTSVSSSAISLSSNSSRALGNNGWSARRPDLARGKRRVAKGRRSRRRDIWGSDSKEEFNREKQVIFDSTELDAAASESDDSSRRQSSSTTDEDVPPFHLDLEDTVPPSPTTSTSSDRWHRRPRPAPRVSDAEVAEREKKAETKWTKSAARREERRLDLLRGDGKSPIFQPEEPPAVPIIPHQPARPSSLRLATPASPEQGFLNDLLHLPLDSLSLSFADVRTVTSDDAPSLSASADTVYAIPVLGEDMICVEALVVRKAGYEDDEGWGFGGEADGWGFGGEDDLEEYG